MQRITILLLLVCAVMFSTAVIIHAQEDDELLPAVYYYTHHGIDGNRFVEGRGTFPNVRVVDLPLGGLPLWVVGVGMPETVLDDGFIMPYAWAVALEDGAMQGTFLDETGQLTISSVLADMLPPDMPPVFAVDDFGAFPLQDFPVDVSPLTHPVSTEDRTLYIANNGDIVLLDSAGEQITRLPFNALPDARIVLSANAAQAAVYVGATDQRYVHGVLGDDLEAAALMVMNLADGGVPVIIELGGDEVFEGLFPMWADVTGDGVPDLITTVSDATGGAQVRVYSAADGALLASGAAVGEANRWRHQLAWGAFGANGENELVEVLTPHISGMVGFYRHDGGSSLELVASLPGYTSHIIGSRNLDMAVAGDFDGDGQPEIVLPDQERGRIAGLRRTAEGEVFEAWTLPLDGVLVTNLAAVSLPDGRLALAAGVDAGGAWRLRVWLPG